MENKENPPTVKIIILSLESIGTLIGKDAEMLAVRKHALRKILN